MRRFQNPIQWISLLLAVVLMGTAGPIVFAQTSAPTLTGVQPNRSANDVDTPVEITGTGFSNTGGVPQVYLGALSLTQVTWLNETTLSAQIPWGIKADTYDLRVVNPDGGEATLDSAFEVTEGIGTWNTNAIDGGPVQIVLPIPNTAGLVYAYSVATSAIYRSTDYGAHWATVGHAGGQFFTYDPLNPNYLYLNTLQSSDGGVTWHDLFSDFLWPGTDRHIGVYTQVFPDPTHAGTLFMATANIPTDSGEAAGLIRSEDYGLTWETIETGLLADDRHVTALEFYASTIYLGTRAGNLYQSTDGGDSWQQMGSTNALPSIGIVKVNPYEPSELWITTHHYVTASAQIATLDLADPQYPVSLVPAWSQESYPKTLGFLSANSVFIGTNWDNGWITTNDGANWDLFQPSTGKPGYSLALDPWDSSQNTFYIADEQYGVQKTTDHGVNWTPINQGLHAMSPDYLAVDPENPSRVYAKITENGWPGIFISADGGQNWAFSSLQPAVSGHRPITSMLAVSGNRVFAGAHGNDVLGYGPQLFISEDQGGTWRNIAIAPNPDYSDSFHMPWTLRADPGNPQTLLLTVIIGNRSLTPDQYVSEIYRSTDQGENWQRVNLEAQLGYPVNNLNDLGFDPQDPDIVYATGTHVILKSSDNGASWSTLIHSETSWFGGPIAVEPVPPYRVYVGDQVSTDGGTTWDENPLPIGVNRMVFVPESDTLYIAGEGLAVSMDGGTTWRFPQGSLATARINGLAVSRSDQRTVVYVGTPGGDTQAANLSAAQRLSNLAASLEAGVYRLTEVRFDVFLPLLRR